MFPLWLIPLLPLAGFVVCGLAALVSARTARGPSRGLVGTVAVLASLLSFVAVCAATARIWSLDVPLVQPLWEWLPLPRGPLSFGFQFDRLTATMLLFVTGIATLIHLYSVGYMKDDRGFARFMAWLNLFLASMIVLVLGDSLPTTFLGWEGVGLCSYLLIGFWKDEHANNDAARKAFVFNRIGDLGFLLGAFALYAAMGDNASLRYVDIAAFFQTVNATDGSAGALAALKGSPLVLAAAALIFLGCTGKSAQLPLATWLPDAMAGPTPVSALIHAATMVTAGVYLVARLGDVYAAAPQVLTVIAIVGAATALWGAIAGLVQWDIKKVLAYSTVSQLGFMFMAAGVGAFDVAIYHVYTHAFFKAVLFLGAGSVIHALHHEQDIRRMGALRKALPITFSAMVFGYLAIVGFPGTSGFMSKDLILERLWAGDDVAKMIGLVATVTVLITAIYMTRMMVLVFGGPSRVPAETRAHVHEAPWTMSVPVLTLGFGAMVAGCVWTGLVPQLNAFPKWLEPVLGPAQRALHPAAHGDHTAFAWLIAVVGTAVAGIGAFGAWLLWRRGTKETEPRPLDGFAAGWTFGLDRAYELLIVRPLQALTWVWARVINEALLGGLLRVVAEIATFLGDGYASCQRARLRTSLALSLVGTVVLVAWLLMPVLGRAG